MPHSSVAIYVLVRDLLQPLPDSVFRTEEKDGLPVQLSVAVGVPTGNVDGLHPSASVEGHEVIPGVCVSLV